MYVWGWNERGQLGLPSKMVRELNKTQIEQHNTTALTNNDPVDNSTNNDMASTTSDEQSDAIRATVDEHNTLVIDSEEIVTGKRRRENELSQDRDDGGNTRAADRLPVSQEDQDDFVNIQLLPVAIDMHDDKGNDLVVTSISAGSRHSAAISGEYTWIPANMRRWANVGLLLVQRRRRWASGNPTLNQRLMFAGITRMEKKPQQIKLLIKRGILQVM